MPSKFKIRKGLDLPITGVPEQRIYDGQSPGSVGVVGREYLGLKPKILVREGERVTLGQPLFRDKAQPEIQYTSPGCGTIRVIHRGEKRVLQSIVIDLDGDEEESFEVFPRDDLPTLDPLAIRKNLLASGLWVAFRTRPYSKVPGPDSSPHAIFVTAMDSNPLAVRADVVINESRQDFMDGLIVLSRLTENKVFVCKYPGADIPVPGDSAPHGDRFVAAEFSGPHPAGLPGTHIHLLSPVSAQRTVWHLGYQDVIAIGQLFTTGRIRTERVVALAGPRVKNPRLIRTRLGASTKGLLEGELKEGESRVISGSVLSGYRAAGWARHLGRYHTQISVIPEERERHFLAWIQPGWNRHSNHNVFLSSLFRRKAKFPLTTSQQGSPRAMVPIGSFSRVVPLDILPTILLRSLVVGDTDKAQGMGCLELDEEDLALCSYVCPSKYEYGAALRAALTHIEKEG